MKGCRDGVLGMTGGTFFGFACSLLLCGRLKEDCDALAAS
jgi:hypothetical protein